MILLFVIIICAIVFTLLSHLIYYRSVPATIIEFYLKKSKIKAILSNELKFNEFINSKLSEEKYKLPNFNYCSSIIKKNLDGYDIYKFINKRSRKAIMYLHGGAYVIEATNYHAKFADKIAQQTKCDLYFPIYPLAPKYTYEEAYKLIFDLYNILLSKYDDIVIMGDSAGGGLALGFTQYLNKLNIKLPSKLILISPWVDLSMSNSKIKKYEINDPLLASYGLLEAGKIWKGGLDTKNYKLSPIYGNLDSIPDSLIFVGTRELFYPDVALLNRKLQENGNKSNLFIGKGMNHIYPLYPIPEAFEAIEEIIKFIKYS